MQLIDGILGRVLQVIRTVAIAKNHNTSLVWLRSASDSTRIVLFMSAAVIISVSLQYLNGSVATAFCMVLLGGTQKTKIVTSCKGLKLYKVKSN